MSQFSEIRETKELPYSGLVQDTVSKLKQSSSKREVHPIKVIFLRLKKDFLFKLAFHCRFNSLRIKMHRYRGVNIGNNVYIAKKCILDNSFPEYIYIEDNVALADEVSIIVHTTPYAHFENIIESCVAPVVIKNGAWIGARAIILRGLTIGKKSIVSAGTVVDKNVREKTIVKGNPMKTVADFSNLID